MTSSATDLALVPAPDLPGGRFVRALDGLLTLLGRALGRGERLAADLRRDAEAVCRDARALGEAAGVLHETTRATLPRTLRVGGEAARLVAAWRVHLARTPWLEPDAARRRTDALHVRSAARVHALCAELGGGILKVGQFASCRADLLPEAWVEALGELQDRAPAAPFEEVRALVEAELGAALEEAFAAFDPAPLAAASLAQVHAATLADGTPVAVKVQRPGIDAVLEADLAALAVIARQLRGALPEADLGALVAELARSVREELDYTAEAGHMSDFRELVAGDDRFVVPRVHEALSTGRVLVMERIEGIRLPDFLAGCEARGDAGRDERDALLRLLVETFSAQILGHGLVHGDPHPGNFLVCPGPRLALLDFGSVLHLGPAERRAWAELVGEAMVGRTVHVAGHLTALGFRARDDDPTTLLGFAELVVEAFREGAGAIGDLDVRAQVTRGLALLRDNPVVDVPRHFVLLSRVLGALGGVLVRHGERLSLFPLVAPHLAKALATRPPAP